MSRSARAIRRRERVKRRLRRLGVALATVLIALTTLLYFFPLQSAWLQRLVERELSSGLDRPVSIDAMLVYLFQNRVDIHNVTLDSSVIPSSEATPAPPYRIKKIVLHMSILSLPWRGLESISLVEVHEPDQLAAQFDDSHTFIASGVPGELLENLLVRRQAAPSPPRVPINVAVYRARLTLDVAPSPVSPFTIRLSEGTLRGNRGGDLSTFIKGYVDYGNTLTPYQADLAYRAANESVEGRIALPGDLTLDTSNIAGLNLPFVQASNLSLSLLRQGPAGQRFFDIELTAGECRLPWPGRSKPLEDSGVIARVHFIPPAEHGGLLVVDPLSWRSRFGEFDGRLAFQPDAASTYSLALSHVRLGPAAMREAFGYVEKEFGMRFDDHLTSVSMSVAAEGSLTGGISALKGDWSLSFLTLAHPSLPAPMTLRHVDGTFTKDGMKVDNLALEAFQTTLEGRGHLETEQFQPRRLRMEWNTTTGLQEAGALIATLAPSAPPVNLSGNVRTNGWIQIQFPLDARALETAGFDVSIMPENAVYEMPVRGLRGSIIGGEVHLRPALMEFRDLRVRHFDSLFQVRGTISGENLFWRDPRVSLGIEGSLPLNDFVTQVAPRRPGLTPFVSAFGQMDLKAQLTGRLDSPEDHYWQAEGDIRQATINFPALTALDSINRLEGRWIFNGDMVQVQSLSGEWGPIPFSAQGRFAPRHMALNATSQLNLEDFASQIPALREQYILDGPVTAQATITCAVPDDIFTSGTLSGDVPATATTMLPSALPAGARDRTERIVDEIRRSVRYILAVVNTEVRRPLPILQSDQIDLRGTLNVRDGSFGHVSMPALISRINADMKWEDHRLSWEQGTGMAGRSAIVAGPSFIDLSGPIPAMNFKGEMEDFDLNQWIADWPRDDSTTDTVHRDARTTKTLFTIDLDAKAQRVQIYKYTLGNFIGVMHYEKWRNVPSGLEFDARSANAFGGDAHAAGRLRFVKHEKPYFDFTVTAERVALDQYLQQVSPRHSGIRGVLSGDCHVWGRPKDSRNLRGEGRFVIENSEFMRFPVFEGLADLTRIDSFRQASFSRIEGEYELRDGRVNFTRIVCDNPIVKIQAVGWVDYDMNISFDITLSYFRAIGGAMPVVSGVMKAVDALIGMTVTVTVSGTLEKPVVKLTIL